MDAKQSSTTAGSEHRAREVPLLSGSALIEDIYERHCDSIYRYCFYRLFAKDAVEDVTASVFLRLVQRIDELAGKSETELRRWLYGTASNAITRRLRMKRHRDRVLAAARRCAVGAGSGGRAEGFDRLDWPILYEAIVRLKPRYQHVIVLRFFEALAPGEIAGILGMTPVAVRVTTLRAIRKLRRHLGPAFGQVVAEPQANNSTPGIDDHV